jgi:hypothetical protein
MKSLVWSKMLDKVCGKSAPADLAAQLPLCVGAATMTGKPANDTTPGFARKLHDKRRAAGCQTDCQLLLGPSQRA